MSRPQRERQLHLIEALVCDPLARGASPKPAQSVKLAGVLSQWIGKSSWLGDRKDVSVNRRCVTPS
jgi:hypothetical protein